MTKVRRTKPKGKTASSADDASVEVTARAQCDVHLARAARRKAMRLLELAERLESGTATDKDRNDVGYDVLGVYLETANSAPELHLCEVLTNLATQEVHSFADVDKADVDKPAKPVRVELRDSDEVASLVQREAALLGLARSLDECREAIKAVRDRRKNEGVAWSAGVRLYVGKDAPADEVHDRAKTLQELYRRLVGKTVDERTCRVRKASR
jgi:hypothetical protein